MQPVLEMSTYLSVPFIKSAIWKHAELNTLDMLPLHNFAKKLESLKHKRPFKTTFSVRFQPTCVYATFRFIFLTFI